MLNREKGLIREKTEVVIITHASKTLPELNRKDPLVYPGAPKTDLLDKVLDNLRDQAGLERCLIVFDHKVDCAVSRLYLDNLRQLCRLRSSLRLMVSPTALTMPSQLTATMAFELALESCDQPYLLFWEHDHLFMRDVDWDLVDLTFAAGGKMLRFNEFANQERPEGFECLQTSGFSDQICRTNYYCNKPFLSDLQFCRNLFGLAGQRVPTWNGRFGGFMEGPINQRMLRDQFNLSEQDFAARYPIYLYGPLGAAPMIDHFGVFPGRRARWTGKLKRFWQRSTRAS